MPKQQHLSKGQCHAFFIVRCVETHELKIHGTDSHLYVPIKNYCSRVLFRLTLTLP